LNDFIPRHDSAFHFLLIGAVKKREEDDRSDTAGTEAFERDMANVVRLRPDPYGRVTRQ
jgi:hypothetical protein